MCLHVAILSKSKLPEVSVLMWKKKKNYITLSITVIHKHYDKTFMTGNVFK